MDADAPLEEASARMLYVMAKRYDEWPGEEYDGSSARGAVKGWHKHGVCARRLWLDDREQIDIDAEIAADALERPLGAYFRVNHKDLVGIHSAITEAGVLFATCRVHQGWSKVLTGDRDIAYSSIKLGGHAFAIVGYDKSGLWIQNSWGESWGDHGLARLGYSDWLENGCDVWVARLGAPIAFAQTSGAAIMRAAAPKSYESYVYASLRPYIVTAANDGVLARSGPYGLTETGLKEILRVQLPGKIRSWRRKRVLIYAHGGLVSQNSAVQYVANYREQILNANVYPVAIIWRSDTLTTLKNILAEAIFKRKSEGFLDDAKDFMLDRLDDTIEPIARLLGGKSLWDEMKENAILTSTATRKAKGAGRMVAEHLVELHKDGEVDEIHLVGHSAGSIVLAPLAGYLASRKVPITSLSLWAPACTMDLFEREYRPLIEGGAIEAFDLYTLDNASECDDNCADIYHKSLLYLVSHAFEDHPRIPTLRSTGTPILGLARDVETHIPRSFWRAGRKWITAPDPARSNARHHGDFDDDVMTMLSTLERIVNRAKLKEKRTGVLKAPEKKVAAFREKLEMTLSRRK